MHWNERELSTSLHLLLPPPVRFHPGLWRFEVRQVVGVVSLRQVVRGGGDHVVSQESLLLNTISTHTGVTAEQSHMRVLHTPLTGLGGEQAQV